MGRRSDGLSRDEFRILYSLESTREPVDPFSRESEEEIIANFQRPDNYNKRYAIHRPNRDSPSYYHAKNILRNLRERKIITGSESLIKDNRERGGKGVIGYYRITRKGYKLFKEYQERIWMKEGLPKELSQKDSREPEKSGLIRKVSASVFLLAGLFFMAVPDFTTTGNVIGSSTGANISFFLSLALMIIGGVLLFRSFKK